MDWMLYVGAFFTMGLIWAGYDELRKIRKNSERFIELVETLNQRETNKSGRS